MQSKSRLCTELHWFWVWLAHSFTTLQELTSLMARLLLKYLWRDDKKFTDWGSLLISKQVRRYIHGQLGGEES
jgi:hypothetical protein